MTNIYFKEYFPLKRLRNAQAHYWYQNLHRNTAKHVKNLKIFKFFKISEFLHVQ